MTLTAPAPGRLLRFALTFDGVATALSGAGLAGLAGKLADPLGIPSAVLLGTGLFLLAFGAAVLFLGTRPVVNRRGAGAVVAVNLVWVLDSLLVVFAGLGGLTTLGTAAVLVLAAAVAGLAGLQIAGLRQVSRS